MPFPRGKRRFGRPARVRRGILGASQRAARRGGGVVLSKIAFIFGAGGHARVVASLIESAHSEITFVVPEQAMNDQMDERRFFDRIDEYRRQDIYLGIGDNGIRRRLFERLRSCGVTPARCVAETAFVARSASIGPGAVICPGSAVMANAAIGVDTIVNTLSGIDHDCVLGDHSQVTVGVTFGGTVQVGKNCFFGLKSAVLPNLRIGDNVVVRAGSLVTKDVGDDVVVGGSPASIVRGF